MRTVCYHSYYGGAAMAAGMGEIEIVRDGVLVGTKMTHSGASAAGAVMLAITANYNQNAIANVNVNNPPREETLDCIRTSLPASTSFFNNGTFTPHRIPVRAGDRLSMNGTLVGTNPTSSYLSCDFYVEER